MNSRLTTFVSLLLACMVTAAIVGLARHWLISPVPGVEPAPQQVRSLLASAAIFAVGGLPAVVTTGLMASRIPRATVWRLISVAAIGNIVSANPGLGVLRLLIWDRADWLLTALSLTTVGFVTFTLALVLARYSADPGHAGDTRDGDHDEPRRGRVKSRGASAEGVEL